MAWAFAPHKPVNGAGTGRPRAAAGAAANSPERAGVGATPSPPDAPAWVQIPQGALWKRQGPDLTQRARTAHELRVLLLRARRVRARRAAEVGRVERAHRRLGQPAARGLARVRVAVPARTRGAAARRARHGSALVCVRVCRRAEACAVVPTLASQRLIKRPAGLQSCLAILQHARALPERHEPCSGSSCS